MGPNKHELFPCSNIHRYLACSVDSGTCLKETSHHTGVTFGGCKHQCSVSSLRDSGGMPYKFTGREQDTYRKYMCYDYLLMQLCICTPRQYVAWDGFSSSCSKAATQVKYSPFASFVLDLMMPVCACISNDVM